MLGVTVVVVVGAVVVVGGGLGPSVVDVVGFDVVVRVVGGAVVGGVVVGAAGTVPSVIVAGDEWKLSTPTSPATVAMRIIGALLTGT